MLFIYDFDNYSMPLFFGGKMLASNYFSSVKVFQLIMVAMLMLSTSVAYAKNDDRDDIKKIFQDISREYTGDKCEFIKKLPESFGLIQTGIPPLFA